LRASGRLALILRRAEARRLVGRVHVRRPGRELGRDRVDALEDWADADAGGAFRDSSSVVRRIIAFSARGSGRGLRARTLWAPPRNAEESRFSSASVVPKSHRLQSAQAIGVARNPSRVYPSASASDNSPLIRSRNQGSYFAMA
jgi:hypothetical protein